MIIGLILFIVSFLLPEKYSGKDQSNIKEQENKIKLFLQRELQHIRIGIEEKVDESMVASTEKTERYMERITNEKIMAIQEYSDTVLEQIHKNHEEAVFLYDMLNNKHDQIKVTAGEISSSIDGAKEKLELSIQDTTKELLKGSIRDNLLEKIQNMLQETIQEAIHMSIQPTLQDKINLAVQQEIEESVRIHLLKIIQEKVTLILQENQDKLSTTNLSEKKNPVVRKNLRDKTKKIESEEDLILFENSQGKHENIEDTSKEVVEGVEKFAESQVPIVQEESPITDRYKEKTVKETVKETDQKKQSSSLFSPSLGINEELDGSVPERSDDSGFGVQKSERNRDQILHTGNTKKEKILNLHQAGMSDVAIAKELDLGVGEVKLVIGLYEGY